MCVYAVAFSRTSYGLEVDILGGVWRAIGGGYRPLIR